jgi:hypothetical protein
MASYHLSVSNVEPRERFQGHGHALVHHRQAGA